MRRFTMLPTFAYRLSRRRLASTALSIAALTASAGTSAVWAQAVQLAVLDVRAVAEGYEVSKLLKTRVDNDKNEKIGTLDDLILTKDRRLIAILQVGGFLGLGGYLIAVPYESLNISDDGKKITLAGASKEELKRLPEFHFKR
jgi:PRC-barrel domain protein